MLRILSPMTFKGGKIGTSRSSNVPAANRTTRNGRTVEVVPFDGSASGAKETPNGQPTTTEGNGSLCQSIPVTLTAGFSELNVLDPNSVEIWTGRIIRISSIDEGAYSDFRDNNNAVLPRKPMAVAIVAAGTSERTVRETLQPNLITQGGVIDAVNNRKNQFGRSDFGSDTWLYEMYDYSSMEQFALEAGLGITAVPINLDVRASAGFSSSVKKNKVVLKFFRKAYDVRIDTDINELLQTATTSNDAGVIASVGYGSWGIVEIESDSSLTDIQAALDASFQVDPTTSVNARLNSQMKNVIASFSIRAIFKGVSGNQSVMNVRSVDDLRRVLSNNAEQYSATTPVVPVSFVVKSLANGETMMLRTTMTYTKRDCVPLPEKPKDMKIKVKMVAFTCPKVNDGLTDDEDIYGKIRVDATGSGNAPKFVWDKGIRSLVRVKKSAVPSEGGAYSLNGVADEYGFTMPTDEQSLSNGELWVTLDINDEEWGNPVPYEERIAKLKFKDLFQSIKSSQFRHDNFDAGQKLFFIETNEKGNTNKIKLWFRVVED
ncbi:MAG: thiol-activated cytolysin family protein [Candidatus Kapabacteria bacterium]|nr:thiol-activated cytolysin family protein [Candidatus Kapabacteria bacterium]